MSKRADCHRVGAIIPTNYTFVLSYQGATTEGGEPVPAYGVNCLLDRVKHIDRGEWSGETVAAHRPDGACCVIGLREAGKRFARHGGTGSCTVCGAHYGHGEVWAHKDGEHIHVGHTCAAKYELYSNDSEFEGRYVDFKHRTAAARIIEAKREERELFLAAHEGLAEALRCEHQIVQNIADKLRRYGSITEGQIALVMKLAAEALNPPPVAVNIPAPVGRVTVRGIIVSAKESMGAYPGSRMTVKVITPDGVWLCNGAIPQTVFDDAEKMLANNKDGWVKALRGCEVEFVATLSPSDNAHFAFAKKPAKGRIVSVPAGAEKIIRAEEDVVTPDPFAEFEAAA